MDVKFKVGDTIKRKLSCEIRPGEEGVIKTIYPNNIVVICSDGESSIWPEEHCVFNVEELLMKLCNCALDILMTVGCQCKGN